MKPAFTFQDIPAILTEIARFFSARFPYRPHREEAAFLVGGFLRDAMLAGLSGSSPSSGDAATPHDLDITVPVFDSEVQAVGQELAQRLGGVCVPHNLARGVFQVVVKSSPASDTGPLVVDLVGFTGSIEEDLARRDFTVNAMALPLNHPSLLNLDPNQWNLPPDYSADYWTGAVIDPFGGREDLARKQIRAVTPDVFRYDPGRLLRAVRLAGQLKFRLEPETARQIRADAPLLERVAPERVRDEFMTILARDGARGQLEVLDRLDLLCRIIPELALTKGVDQPRAHYWDVWNHLMHTVEYAEMVTRGHQNSAIYFSAPWTAESAEYFAQEVGDGYSRRTILKLAGLLHDIAKPQTKGPDATGRIRFLGHSELGAEMVEARLTQMRFSSRIVAMVARMVEHHLRPSQLRHGQEEPSRRAMYRYYRSVQDVAVDTVYLAMADYLAAKGPEISADHWANHARMLGRLLQAGSDMTGQSPGQGVSRGPERLLTGHDLMQHFNLPPGPQIGRLLEHIEEARAAGEVSTREEALALAADLKEE